MLNLLLNLLCRGSLTKRGEILKIRNEKKLAFTFYVNYAFISPPCSWEGKQQP